MARGRYETVYGNVRTLFEVGTVGGLTDGELLDRFGSSPREVAELAFAVLVERHGPMVLRACRRILRDEHEAHDAFQATFLVLARKGGTVRRRDTLGPWLHGVACRVAACARSSAARRRRIEEKAADLAETSAPDPPGDDIGAAIHEEIARLPECYRSPVVLCCLEGLTREQAALRLGGRVGTVQSRLARGRERLRDRLVRRGIAPAAAGAAALAAEAEAAMMGVPARWVEATVRSGMGYAAGHAAAGAVPAGVASLLSGVLKVMFLQKLKAVAGASAAVALVGVGVTWGQESPERQAGRSASRDRVAAPSEERLDHLERKIDHLIEALEGSATRAERVDPRALADQRKIAELELARARDRAAWAGQMNAKGYISADQASADQIAVLKAQQALDQAKTRLDQAQATTDAVKPATTPAAPEVPNPPAANTATTTTSTRRLFSDREAEPSRLDRLEHRLEALERRLDALERRPGDRGASQPGNRPAGGALRP